MTPVSKKGRYDLKKIVNLIRQDINRYQISIKSFHTMKFPLQLGSHVHYKRTRIQFKDLCQTLSILSDTITQNIQEY